MNNTKQLGFKLQLKSFLFLLGFLMFQNAEAQYNIPETPKFQTSVYDYYNLLSENEKTNLISRVSNNQAPRELSGLKANNK